MTYDHNAVQISYLKIAWQIKDLNILTMLLYLL